MRKAGQSGKCGVSVMKRAMVAFDRDEYGDWLAWLDCGHTQHVRHQPPFIMREWVTTRQGRQAYLGHRLDCQRCNHFEFPDQLIFDGRGAIHHAENMPRDWRQDQCSAAGQWLAIDVMQGSLRYCAPDHDIDLILVRGVVGVVPPRILYSLQPAADTLFQLVSYLVPAARD